MNPTLTFRNNTLSIFIIVLMIFLLFSVSLNFAEETDVPQQVLDFRQSALQSSEDGDYAQAYQYYQAILETYSDTTYAVDTQADIVCMYIQTEQADMVDTELDILWQNCSSRPEIFDAIAKIGWEFRQYNQIEETVNLCEQAKILPGSESALYMNCVLIEAYLRRGNLDQANIEIESLFTHCSHHPDFVEKVHNLRHELRRLQEFDREIELYNRLLDAFPDHERCLWIEGSRIYACLENGYQEQAKQYANALLNNYVTHPEYIKYAYGMAKDFEQFNDRITASEIYSRLAQLPSNHTVRNNPANQKQIIEGCLKIQDTAQAEAEIEILFSSYMEPAGEFLNAVSGIQNLYMDMKNFVKVLELGQRCLTLYPEHEQGAEVLGQMISVMIQMNHPEAAEAAIEDMFSRYPETPYLAAAVNIIADTWRRTGETEHALDLYTYVTSSYPEMRAELTARRGQILACFDLDQEEAAWEQLDAMIEDCNEMEGLEEAIFQIGEEVCDKAFANVTYYQLSEEDKVALPRVIDVLETTIPMLSDPHYQCMSLYMAGISYWQMGEWYPAADAFLESIEADPHFKYAGGMHWMVAYCYEKLKAAGEIDKEEADAMIEWGYQTLFEDYPNSRMGDLYHTAMKLGQINLARGRPATACVYFNWILDRVENPEDGRVIAIQQILEGKEVCQ